MMRKTTDGAQSGRNGRPTWRQRRGGFAPLLCAALMFSAPLACAQTPAQVQVGMFGAKEKALGVVAQLSALGFGPADLAGDAAGFKVRTRVFDSLAEANFAKSALRGAGYLEAFTVSTVSAARTASVFGDTSGLAIAGTPERDARTSSTAAGRRAIPALVSDASIAAATGAEAGMLRGLREKYVDGNDEEASRTLSEYMAGFPASPRQADAKLMRAYMHLGAGDRASASAQFAELAASDASRPQAGEACLRMGYIADARSATAGEALRCFRRVARGQTAAEPSVRLEAMRRCAALYHRGKDLDTAAAAWAEIERAAPGTDAAAEARVQRGAVAYEQALNGKGRFSDCRTLCDSVSRDFPNACREVRATAALIAIEAMCRENQYRQVIKRIAGLGGEYDGLPERQLINYWGAKALLETGNPAAAIAVLDSIVAAGVDTQTRFHGIDVVAAARRLSAQARGAGQVR